MRSRLSIAYLSFVFVLLQAVLMAHVAFSAAVPHRTVEMTPVAAEGELAWSTFHQPSEFQIVNTRAGAINRVMV